MMFLGRGGGYYLGSLDCAATVTIPYTVHPHRCWRVPADYRRKNQDQERRADNALHEGRHSV